MSKLEFKREAGTEDQEYSTAYNTEILLDGKVVEGLQSISIDLSVDSLVPIVTLKVIPESISGKLELHTLENIGRKVLLESMESIGKSSSEIIAKIKV